MIDTEFYTAIYDRDLEWFRENAEKVYFNTDEILQLDKSRIQLGIVLKGELSDSNRQKDLVLTPGDILGDLLFNDVDHMCYTTLKESHILLVDSEKLTTRLREDRIFSNRLQQAVTELAYARVHANQDTDEVDLTKLESLSIASTRFARFILQDSHHL